MGGTMHICSDCLAIPCNCPTRCPKCKCGRCQCEGKIWLEDATPKLALPVFSITSVVTNGKQIDLDAPLKVIIDRETLVIT
jgi:hypothetical protein